MKFNTPRFNFKLFLTEGKEKEVICTAETYEITPDGSITFFHICELDDGKKIKMPALTYPNGKWLCCAIMTPDHKLPAFDKNNHSMDFHFTQKQEHSQEQTTDPQIKQQQNNPTHTPTNVPGVNSRTDFEVFKKQKNDFVETQIKEFSKTVNQFVIDECIDFITKNPDHKQFGKITESDVIWTTSTLIRNKMILSKKFSNDEIQNKLRLMMPDIMRRHWAGKVGPIIQVLKEKEETKNATAIDVAVWMIKNNFVE